MSESATVEAVVAQLQALIEEHRWSSFQAQSQELAPQDLAELLFDLDIGDRVLAFRALPRELAGEVFSYLETPVSQQLVGELTNDETRALIAELDPDDRATLLTELPAPVTRRLMTMLEPAALEQARKLLGYPEDSIGRRMTPEYVAVRSEWTIERALAHIRVCGPSIESIAEVYVTDQRGRLLDALRLRQFVLGDPEASVETVMDRRFQSLSAFADQEEAVRLMQHYDLIALPVVDSQGILLGVVTIDDVMDVAEEEVTEDFHHQGGVAVIRENIRDASVFLLWRKRIGWLVILVFMNIFSGAGIAFFEETIAAAVALVFFLPVLIGSGGNAGSQAATLMVRSLATGDVEMKDWLRLLIKEVSVALFLGLAMALAVTVVAVVRAPEIAVVVAASMVATVLIGSLIGMSLPFVINRLRLDPATASAPLVTSMCDICGVLIYFGLASWYLG